MTWTDNESKMNIYECTYRNSVWFVRTLRIFNSIPSLKGAIKLQHLIKHSKWRKKQKHSCLNPAWTYIQTVTFRISSKLHFTAQINRKIAAKQTHKFQYTWFILCVRSSSLNYNSFQGFAQKSQRFNTNPVSSDVKESKRGISIMTIPFNPA